MNNKLRTFKLIDEEGYLNHHPVNRTLMNKMKNKCFSGKMENTALCEKAGGIFLITPQEFKYFEEVLPAKDNTNTESDTQTHSKTHSQPLQGTFSDETIHCIMEDCKALDASLWFDKDSVVLLWNEDEYVIESVADYHTIIDAIKLLQTFVEV